jgi:O-antigen/teichoic acid export membrane protein
LSGIFHSDDELLLMNSADALSESQSLKRKVLQGFAWEASSKLVMQIISWASTIIVARLLTPDDYGIVAIAFLFTQLAENIVDMGMGQSLIMKRHTTREQEDGIFCLAVAFGVFLFACLYFSATHIAGFYKDERLVTIVRVLGLNAILSSLRIVPYGLLMQRMQFRYRAWTEMASTFATVCVSLTLAYAGYGFWALVAGNLCGQLVAVLTYLPILGRLPSIRFRLQEVLPFFGFGLRITGNNAVYYFYERAPSFVSGKILGMDPTGHFTLATSFAAIPINKIGTMFNRIGFPTFSQLKDDRPQARNYFFKMHRYLVMLVFPALVGIALVAHDLLAVLVTEKWALAASVLQVLCVWNLMVVSAMIPQYGLLLGLGRVDLAFRYHLANLVLLPIGSLVGAQSGLIAMSWGLAIAYVPAYLVLMRYSLKEISGTFVELLHSFAPGVFGTLFMAFVVVLFQSQLGGVVPGLRLAICLVVGAISYVAFIFVAYRRGIEEIQEGIALLRGRK